MITPEQIPDEVVEAAAKSMGWTSAIALPQDKLRFKGHIAAAIAAWPGAWHVDAVDFEPKLILPLTHEDNDDQG